MLSIGPTNLLVRSGRSNWRALLAFDLSAALGGKRSEPWPAAHEAPPRLAAPVLTRPAEPCRDRRAFALSCRCSAFLLMIQPNSQPARSGQKCGTRRESGPRRQQ